MKKYKTNAILKWLFAIFSSTILLLPPTLLLAQIDFTNPDKGKPHMNIKVGGYFLIHGGYGFSAAFGSWTEYRIVQPSFNLSVNVVAKRTNLGNRDRYQTRLQVNTLLTPMVTFGTDRSLKAFYQEINPFYFGNLGAVYANHRHSLTLGSNFVVMPRAFGGNVTTFRNRTQQLVYIGIRTGGTDWDINLNLYEDFFLFTETAIGQGLADNFDRFYTGGGNLQVRFRNISAKFYSDIYTGNFPRDLFDNPDLYHPYSDENRSIKNDSIGGRKHTRRHPRYVAQDPGQKLFNTGRNFFVFEMTPNVVTQSWQSPLNPTIQLYTGWQGGKVQMSAQNWIHGLDIMTIDKINPKYKTDTLYHKHKLRYQERLHRFYPAFEEGRFIWGAGFFLNSIPAIKP